MNRTSAASTSAIAAVSFSVALAVCVTVARGSLSAGFIADDWLFLALGRHLEDPTALFFADHSFTYFYRPVGMLVWWLVTRAFGTDPSPQYLVNLVLHCVNAGLVTVIALRLGCLRTVSVAAGLAFAVHPATLPPTLWLSDRFDLLVTAFMLGAILAVTSRLSGRLVLVTALSCAILASGSKETSVVLVPAVSLALLFEVDRPLRSRLILVVLIAIAFLPMFAGRAVFVADVESTLGVSDLAIAMTHGTLDWFRHFPTALLGFTIHRSVAVLASFVVLILLCAVTWRSLYANQRVSPLVVGLATLIPLAAIVQSPVTSTVLIGEAPLNVAANGRFYYLAIAAVIPLLAIGSQRFVRARTAWTMVVGLLGAFAIVYFAGRSSVVADEQIRATLPGTVVARSVAAQIDAGSIPTNCLVSVVGVPANVAGFNGFADVAVKALMDRGDRRMSCVIRTVDGPYYVMTPIPLGGRCLDSDRPELMVRNSHTIPLSARPIGNLCMRFPVWLGDGAASARQHGAIVLVWDEFTGKVAREQTR